jgi:hypothetical protein
MHSRICTFVHVVRLITSHVLPINSRATCQHLCGVDAFLGPSQQLPHKHYTPHGQEAHVQYHIQRTILRGHTDGPNIACPRRRSAKWLSICGRRTNASTHSKGVLLTARLLALQATDFMQPAMDACREHIATQVTRRLSARVPDNLNYYSKAAGCHIFPWNQCMCSQNTKRKSLYV